MSSPFDQDWNAPQEPKAPTAYADITVILDRSASMSSMQEGVVKGFNDFVIDMRRTPGDSKWTLVQFDDPSSAHGAGERFPHVLFEERGEKEVPLLRTSPTAFKPTSAGSPVITSEECVVYQPRGNTALVDAVCLSIQRAEVRTSGQDHVQHVVMIVTDGEENNSREFTSDRMREMVARTQKQGWQYLYIGANQDAFHEAGKYNLNQSLGWLQNAPGGCLVAPDARNAYDFQPTAGGIAQAITSGFIGATAMVSGAVYMGRKTDINI